jgi:hypothetical protein
MSELGVKVIRRKLRSESVPLPRRVVPVVVTAILLLGLACQGCGSGDRCSLRGTVKYNGELLPEGDVRLDPVNNPDAARASAHIQNGQFEIPHDARMLAGTYRVAVWAVRPTGRKVLAREALHGGTIERVVEEEQYIPEHYNRRSTLRVELAPGENEKEFELEGKLLTQQTK